MSAGRAERAGGGLPRGGLDLHEREHRDVAELHAPLRAVDEQHDGGDLRPGGLHEVARALDVKCVFAEKVQAGDETDATGKPVTKLAMRRFSLKPGERYVVAEDVVTKGGRVQETIDLVKAAGAEVAAVVLLVDRSKGAVSFGNIPMVSLVQIQPTTWEPAACPLCAAGGHPVHPGS